MNYEFIKYEEKNNVAWLVLNRPDLHNAFNEKFISEITDVFLSINKKSHLRLCILKTSGTHFCAGADLNWMKSMATYTQAENEKDAKKLQDMFLAIDNLNIPLIGLVRGSSMGGGVGLISVCDYVAASDNAMFGFTETRLGLVPAVISPFCIKKIGASNARAWFLSGERFGVQTAKDIGLIQEIFTSGEEDKVETRLIKSFLAAGPLASRHAKKLIKEVVLRDDDKAHAYTRDLIAKLRVSDEGQEGMQSLLNKTKPKWIQHEN